MLYILLLFFLLVSTTQSCERHSQNVANLTLDEITTKNVNDSIRVFFMRAPLLKESFGDNLADIGAFHSSVGFQNIRTGEVWTFEFDAKVFTDAIFPHVEGNETLIWNTGSEVCFEGKLNKTPARKLYWTIARLVSVIDGETYNTLANWIHEYAQNTPLYQALNIFDVSSDPPTLKYQASTCSDFTFNVLAYLKNDLNVKLDAVIAPATTSFALLLDTEHSYEIVKENPFIYEFYKSLVSALSDVKKRAFHFGDLLEAALVLELREFYVYLGNKNYYRVPLRKHGMPMGVFVYSPPSLFAAEVLTYPKKLGIYSETWAGNVSGF